MGEPMFGEDGKPMFGPSGRPLLCDEGDTCCGEPCDCETSGPTAEASATKSAEPCTWDLFDESTPGECGEIVSWRWLKNGVQFSTAQNPTDIELENDDVITLEIEDAAGCPATTQIEIACEDCCEEEGKPTADFSYEQTDDDPCTINLFDESTNGPCGEIVSWAWYWDAETTPFSTAQNPTGIEVIGEDVTLVVTDSAGCSHAKVSLIVCDEIDSNCCECFTESLPDSVTMTMSGFREFLGFDDCGDDLNHSFVLPKVLTGDPPSNCHYEDVFTVPYGGSVRLTVVYRPFGIEATMSYALDAGGAVWESPCPDGPDCSTHNTGAMTLTSTDYATFCGMIGDPPPGCVVHW